MVVRSTQFVNEDGSTAAPSTVVTQEVTLVENVLQPIEATKTIGSITLPITGQNIVQNAVVSEDPPANPYEGQVWVKINVG